MNVFYGPARLEEIPTDREPEHYEYYRVSSPCRRCHLLCSLNIPHKSHISVRPFDLFAQNPVVRLMAQVVPDPVREYERDIALRYRSWQKMRLRYVSRDVGSVLA